MENINTLTSQELTAKAVALKINYQMGGIDKKKAETLAKPYIVELNKRMEALAAKFGRRPQRVNFNNIGPKFRGI